MPSAVRADVPFFYPFADKRIRLRPAHPAFVVSVARAGMPDDFVFYDFAVKLKAVPFAAFRTVAPFEPIQRAARKRTQKADDPVFCVIARTAHSNRLHAAAAVPVPVWKHDRFAPPFLVSRTSRNQQPGNACMTFPYSQHQRCTAVFSLHVDIRTSIKQHPNNG